MEINILYRSKWYFDCLCQRCCDPKECDSHMSSLLCTKPAPVKSKSCGGQVMSKSPTDGDSDWSCQVSFIGQEHTVPSTNNATSTH